MSQATIISLLNRFGKNNHLYSTGFKNVLKTISGTNTQINTAYTNICIWYI